MTAGAGAAAERRRSLRRVKGWPRSSERELRDYEGELDVLLEELHRLRRQRDRPGAGLLDPASGPELVVGDCLEPGIIACAVCARDHGARIGPELLLAGEDSARIVCWACGAELALELAAEVLAKRSDYAEQGAYTMLSIAEGWLLQHIREAGNVERAERFERRCEELRQARQTSKAGGYGDPATWR